MMALAEDQKREIIRHLLCDGQAKGLIEDCGVGDDILDGGGDAEYEDVERAIEAFVKRCKAVLLDAVDSGSLGDG
jgi:hypothetical protein